MGCIRSGYAGGSRDYRDWRSVHFQPKIGHPKLWAATSRGRAEHRLVASPEGVRDIVAGLVVVVMLQWGGARIVGIVLLTEALIPLGDMSLILAAKEMATVS